MFKLKNKVVKCSCPRALLWAVTNLLLKKKIIIRKTIQKKSHKRTTEVFVGYFRYVSPKIQSINIV